MEKSKNNKSRYQRVMEILDAADTGSASDYCGAGKFWKLPLEEFKTVKVCGVRMIAPQSTETLSTGSESYLDNLGQRRRPYDYHRMTAASTTETSSCCSSSQEEIKTGAKDTGKSDKVQDKTPETAASSCCSSGDPSDTATDHCSSTSSCDPAQPGRGAASGLVKALKGEVPFDNRHYQRFMWDGQTVDDSDIQFISDWIDDGCPETDAPVTSTEIPMTDSHRTGLISGSIGHPPMTDKSWNQVQSESGGLKQRKNAESLTPIELQNFRAAVGELMALNKFPLDKRSYHSWGQIHGDTCQHGWEQFLPWHRIYLYEFELALQDISPDITLPYWDWPVTAYNNGLPPSGDPYGSGIIPTIYRGFLTDETISRLKEKGMPAQYLDNLGKIVNEKFNSGTTIFARAGLIYSGNNDDEVAHWRNVLSDELSLTNPLWHRFRYPGQFYDSEGKLLHDGNPMANPFHHHYPRQEDIDQLMEVSNWPDFGGGHYANQSFGILSQNPHNTGHIWSGGSNPDYKLQQNNPNEPANGDMFTDLLAAYDPLFWGHHSNVDRMWANWQDRHPGLNPDDPDDVLVPFNYAVKDSLSYTKLGYEYVNDSYFYKTSPGMGINKFHSENAGVKAHVLPRHKRAEIRIHGLRKPEESHFIRVFINLPDANAKTPITDNDNYVGTITTFGHGPCIGGPGHCDVPAADIRKFDRRGRHHNTPFNLKFDATDAVKKLMASGATDFNVQIMALSGSGEIGKHTLAMDGVSLHFFD